MKKNRENKIINRTMENYEFEKLIDFNIKNKLNYVSNTISIKHILYEKTNTITTLAVDYNLVYCPEIITFSTFIKVIEGNANVTIDNDSIFLLNGESLIIPDNTSYIIKSTQRFKILSIIIKNKHNEFNSKKHEQSI